MKILQVNILYNQGSTGKIVADIHKVLCEDEHESIICYGAGQNYNNSNIYKLAYKYELSFYRILSHIIGLQYGVGYISTYRLIKIIKKEKPDIVHLHCINGFFINIYRLFDFLKKNEIKTVCTLHAEFMYTGSCGYSFECDKWKIGCGNCSSLWNSSYSYYFDRTSEAWKKMYNAFENFNNILITCVSSWVESRAKQAPILKGKEIITIENGIDTKEIFHPVNSDFLKDKLGIKDEKIILHVTANFSTNENDIKGGGFILRLANKIKDKNIKIIIVGSNYTNFNLSSNVISVGKVMDQKILAQYYSMADLTVITSKKETFSMPCAESLACGTPVVGFKAGGPETISLKEYSEFVEYGNIDELVACVEKWINFKVECGVDISKYSKDYYSKETMYTKYKKAYEYLLS